MHVYLHGSFGDSVDRQEGARVTDSCELPNLGAKSKSRGLTHVVHVHISSENNQRRKKINL